MVPLETRQAKTFTGGFDNTNGYTTGIALGTGTFNPFPLTTTNVSIIIRDNTGKVIDSARSRFSWSNLYRQLRHNRRSFAAHMVHHGNFASGPDIQFADQQLSTERNCDRFAYYVGNVQLYNERYG